MKNRRLGTVLTVLLLPVLGHIGCTSPRTSLGTFDDEGDAGAPGFLNDASVADAADTGVLLGACATNECPAGKTTCPNEPFPCSIDLTSDDANCGACGHACPDLTDVFAVSHCMGGTCQMGCGVPGRQDCNKLPEDGCEASIASDPNNCGGCGIVCPKNYECSEGQCSCAIAQSCGTCGNICPAPETPLPEFPEDWHVDSRCNALTGECWVPLCVSGWDDCNRDFTTNPKDPVSNGCETFVQGADPNNCGACGQQCAPGEVCLFGQCRCGCGSSCFDVSSDVGNCGGCGNFCLGLDGPTAHGRPLCEHGVCDYGCNPGWADCDGDITNGCETSLLEDPSNCGGCGVHCNGIEGQPCIEGRCATKECPVQ